MEQRQSPQRYLKRIRYANKTPGADDGTLVVLDWGAVLDVPRWTRESILNVALSVGREDHDGIINEMYRLGMISPEVSRGEIHEGRLTDRLHSVLHFNGLPIDARTITDQILAHQASA